MAIFFLILAQPGLWLQNITTKQPDDSQVEVAIMALEEAFGDRTYESDGSLRNRNLDHALITNPKKAAKQAQMITNEGKVVSFDGSDININAQTICIHSDTPNALDIAKKVNESIN